MLSVHFAVLAAFLKQGIWSELGPDNLNRQIDKYIWNGKDHPALQQILEYLNRYVYLPRIKNREVLVRTIQTAVAGLVSGPFAYAERWDDTSGTYVGLGAP